jgi:uncharacterized damage-inducible protein DinB
MNLQEIMTLFDYNYWTNKKLLAKSSELTQEQFESPSTHSFGSLRGTLLHTMDAEYAWRILCTEGRFIVEMTEAEFPTLAAIQTRWQEEEIAMRDYLNSLHDDDLYSIVSYVTDEGVKRERILWNVFFHVVNHGMQHRSEAAHILTQFGHSPGEIDFTLFLNESAGGAL